MLTHHLEAKYLLRLRFVGAALLPLRTSTSSIVSIWSLPQPVIEQYILADVSLKVTSERA